MKNYLQYLNKYALKLSLICSLNWLVKVVGKGQFYLFTATFLGLLTYYMPLDLQRFTIVILELIVLINGLIATYYAGISRDFRRVRSLLQSVVLLAFFVAGNVYIEKHIVTESMIHRLLTTWFISFIFALLVTVIQPRLFKHYLFKYVLDKDYLGIRTISDPLPPEKNIFHDAEEVDVDKRMRLINQNVIKQPYQDVVELSFLKKEVTTGIHHRIDLSTKEKVRMFEEVDTIYSPVFRVYPFGIGEDFSHQLIQLKLSRKTAFTSIGSKK
ncbi:hypothetical protein [Streptococcus suis]